MNKEDFLFQQAPVSMEIVSKAAGHDDSYMLKLTPVLSLTRQSSNSLARFYYTVACPSVSLGITSESLANTKATDAHNTL